MSVSRERGVCRCRLGVAGDICKLEWHGAFTAHRNIIEEAFAAQAAGRGLVFVADLGGFPIAQLWVRFGTFRLPRLWAFRVLPAHQGRGVGSRLLAFGEAELAERGFSACEIGAERSDLDALRFYRERGYSFAYEQIETFSYLTPWDEWCEGRADQHILQKSLPVANEVIPRAARGRAVRRSLDAWPANAPAAARSRACHNSPRGEGANSAQRNALRNVRARDRADKTESRS